MSGIRLNEGKIRHDLIPAYSINELAKLLTKGTEKYEERNWEKGMKWSTVIASLKRHLNAFERGEDFDKESGMLHILHVMCNSMFLVEYYRTYPTCDDRVISKPFNNKNVIVQVEDVIADFNTAFKEKFNIEIKNHDELYNKLKSISKDEEFMLSIKPKVNSNDIKFKISQYTSTIFGNLIKKWLEKYNFIFNDNKITDLIASNIKDDDVVITCEEETFLELNNKGICCYCVTDNNNYLNYKYIKSITDLN